MANGKPLSTAGLGEKYLKRRREAFLERVEKKGPSFPGLDEGCWLWTGSVATAGYGQFGFGGRNCSAHRVSLVLLGGETLHEGLVVRHLCHRKLCVNPDHLTEGTYLENAKDRALLREMERKQLPPTPEEQAASDELWDLIL